MDILRTFLEQQSLFALFLVIGLGAEARMNMSSVADGNWEWRLLPEQITASVSERLMVITETYGRGISF